MALKKTTDLGKNQFELEILIEKEVFDEACNESYKKNVRKLNVPGFRKGKAPRAFVEKMYGKGVFYEDAFNKVIPPAFAEAVEESKLRVVGSPEYDVEEIDDEGVHLKAKVYVYPEVKIEDYFGVEVEYEEHEITDEAVDAEIEKARQRNARTTEVTREAKLGDTATIDYEGEVEGIKFDGGKGENHPLKLGSGQFIPGFEDQVVGHKTGEEFDVTVTFPEEYGEPTLAGKPAIFKVKINKIEETEIPELDDDFAKDVSEFDTLDEYRASIKAKLIEDDIKMRDTMLKNKIIEKLVEKMEVDVPAPMIDSEVANILGDHETRMKMQGLDLETYMKYTGQTLDQLKEEVRPQAEMKVKSRLLLEKIVELEGITASKEDIDKEYQSIAEAYGMPVEDVKKYLNEKQIAQEVAVNKAVDLLFEKAVKKAVKPESTDESGDKKKKPAAKKTTANKSTAKKETKAEETKKPAAKKTTAKKTTAKKKAAEEPKDDNE